MSVHDDIAAAAADDVISRAVDSALTVAVVGVIASRCVQKFY